MNKSTVQLKIRTGLMIVIGSGFLAFSIKCIYDPVSMVPGGFSGLAILVKELTDGFVPGGVPLGITTILLNVPVFLIAGPTRGWGFVRRTLAATLLLSLWLLVLPEVGQVPSDYLLAAVFGGVTAGVGIGMVLATGSATGGTDMIASLLHLKIPFYTIAQIMAVLDGAIILMGAFVFGIPVALYAVISIYITAKISDAIVGGIHFAKSVYIITSQPDRTAQKVIKQMERGVTAFRAVGMYTGKERKVLFCIVSKKEIVQLKNLVYESDENAFVIVSDVKEVLGEGFL